MLPKPEDILHKIEESRKLKGRSKRDCADLLKISKRDYQKFEQGENVKINTSSCVIK